MIDFQSGRKYSIILVYFDFIAGLSAKKSATTINTKLKDFGKGLPIIGLH